MDLLKQIRREEYQYLSGNITNATIYRLQALTEGYTEEALKVVLVHLNQYFQYAHEAKALIRSPEKEVRAGGWKTNEKRIEVLTKVPPEIRNLLKVKANAQATGRGREIRTKVPA